MFFAKLRQAPFEITRAFLSLASAQSGDECSGEETGELASKGTCRGRIVSHRVQKGMSRWGKQCYETAFRQPATLADDRWNIHLAPPKLLLQSAAVV